MGPPVTVLMVTGPCTKCIKLTCKQQYSLNTSGASEFYYKLTQLFFFRKLDPDEFCLSTVGYRCGVLHVDTATIILANNCHIMDFQYAMDSHQG